MLIQGPVICASHPALKARNKKARGRAMFFIASPLVSLVKILSSVGAGKTFAMAVHDSVLVNRHSGLFNEMNQA